jgi:hypothetical protein
MKELLKELIEAESKSPKVEVSVRTLAILDASTALWVTPLLAE